MLCQVVCWAHTYLHTRVHSQRHKVASINIERMCEGYSTTCSATGTAIDVFYSPICSGQLTRSLANEIFTSRRAQSGFVSSRHILCVTEA